MRKRSEGTEEEPVRGHTACVAGTQAILVCLYAGGHDMGIEKLLTPVWKRDRLQVWAAPKAHIEGLGQNRARPLLQKNVGPAGGLRGWH